MLLVHLEAHCEEKKWAAVKELEEKRRTTEEELRAEDLDGEDGDDAIADLGAGGSDGGIEGEEGDAAAAAAAPA